MRSDEDFVPNRAHWRWDPRICLLKRPEPSSRVIERALDLFGSSGLAFSFNGGKDSTVVLHLLRAAAARRSLPLSAICTFYFVRPDDFPEIRGFVEEMDKQYSMGMRYFTGDFRSDVEELVRTTPVRAIVLGTRR